MTRLYSYVASLLFVGVAAACAAPPPQIVEVEVTRVVAATAEPTERPTTVQNTALPKPAATIRPPVPTPAPILMDEARAIVKSSGFAYLDHYTTPSVDVEGENVYAYRYTSTGVTMVLWSLDNATLESVSIIFLFDDTASVRLAYANRGIEALRGIIDDAAVAALIDLNAAYNASPHGRVDQEISRTLYRVTFNKDDVIESCPAKYDYCYLFMFPSITYTGEALFRYYRIDLWLTE